MTKKPEETKKGLACCAASIYQCEDDCPYREECRNGQGGKAMMEDALALIQQLQAENAEKDAGIQQTEAERDELMVFVKGQCSACKFSDYSYTEDPCDSCFADRRSKWQWRGVQKEE